MTISAELEDLHRIASAIGYLHHAFSVEIMESGAPEREDACAPARPCAQGPKILVVRNEMTHAKQRYRCDAGDSWLARFEQDLTAGAFN